MLGLASHSIKTGKVSLCEQSFGKLFLVDLGADLSVFPALVEEKLSSSQSAPLVAANGSTIWTFGTGTLHLRFPGGLNVPHTFALAEVNQPIVGVDFFKIIDLDARQLLHCTNTVLDGFEQAFPASVAKIIATRDAQPARVDKHSTSRRKKGGPTGYC